MKPIVRWTSRLNLAVLGLIGAVAVGGCSPIVAFNQALVPSEGYTQHRDLAYGPKARNQLDVFVPSKDTDAVAPKSAPVVVFFYGGSWRNGERAYYRFVGEALASRGFIAVIPDYSLYPEARFPTFVEDGAAALRWVRDHIAAYGGDPDAIVLMGHSAGAHIAALLATDRRYLARAGVPYASLRGVVGLAGPYAFDPGRYRYTRPIFEGTGDVRDSQPLTFVQGGEPPMLLLHGADDSTVSPTNSRELADALRRAGGRVDLVEFPDVGHIGIVIAFAKPFRAPGGVLDTVGDFIAARFAETAKPEAGGGAAGAQPSPRSGS